MASRQEHGKEPLGSKTSAYFTEELLASQNGLCSLQAVTMELELNLLSPDILSAHPHYQIQLKSVKDFQKYNTYCDCRREACSER
jgi:hypothetical protein